MPIYTAISAGSTATISLPAGSTLKVSGSGTAQIVPPGVPGTDNAQRAVLGELSFGPFASACSVSVVGGASGARYYSMLSGDSVPPGVAQSGAGPISVDALQAALPYSATWANRAALVTAGQYTAFFTDVGVGGGSVWTYSGGRWRPYGGRVTLRNLTSSVTHSTTTRTVMDFVLIPAGLWQDGDNLEMEWCKTLTGTDTDTTETALGTVAGTFGEALNLTTATLTNTNPMVNSRWRWRRLGSTSVRPVTITGSVGLGGAGSIVTDPTITTNLDTTDSYLQISGKLTTGGGPITALRAHSVTLIAGA